MYKQLGILIAAALATIYLTVVFTRMTPAVPNATATLPRSVQTLRVAQTEKFQSDFRFAESNIEAAQLVGRDVKLGRIPGAAPVVELNVREGGVIELLQDERDKAGQRLRAVVLPLMTEPVGSLPVQWQCYSANWEDVAGAGIGCRFDATAWEIERKYVMRQRAAKAQMEQDTERAGADHESDRARADFERQRAQLARESERAREEEAMQLARIERETELARIEYERQRQRLP